MATFDGKNVIPAADLPRRSAGLSDVLVGVVRTDRSLASFPLSELPTPRAAQDEIDALRAGQQTSAIYTNTLEALQQVAGSYVGQGAFVNNGAGAGQYIWNGSSWQFSRADLLSHKADRSEVDPINDWKSVAMPAVDALLKQGYLGYPATPVTGDVGAAGYTFVAPQQASFAGSVDQIEIFGGTVEGPVVVKVFEGSGSILSEVSRTTINVLPGGLNVIPVAIPIAPGQRIGLFFAAASVRYSSSTSESRRAWRANGDATVVDTSSALRIVELMMRARVRVAAYSSEQVDKAVTAGDLIVDARDGYSVASRRPLILDLDGTLGPVDSLYVPRDLWFSRGTVSSVNAVNPVVTTLAGGYARIALAPGGGWWDTGFINTVYYDPTDNEIKVLTGTAGPAGRQLTKMLPLFQLTGRNGGWRSASGLNVDVRSRPRGQAVLADIYDAVLNPLRDCRIVLLGDSITWGQTAANIGSITPNERKLTDARDNFTSGSWANRLRRWASKLAVNEQNLTSPTPGQSVHSGKVTFTPRYDDSFQAIRADGQVPRDGGAANSAALLKRYIDTPNSPNVADGRVVFRYVGGDIDIVHAALDGAQYDFYVDGVLRATYNYVAPVRFGVVTSITGVAFGSHVVEVVTRGAQLFRMEAVRRSKIMSFANNGLNGSNSSEWLPGGDLLSGGVPADTTHIIIQLGTNDRAMSAGAAYPAGAAGTYQNLVDIVTWLRENRPLALVTLMAPPYTPGERDYGDSGQEAVAVRRAAKALGTGFIDNWSHTYEVALTGEVWLADGIHPNQNGHRYMFQNILRAITGAGR